MSKLDEMKKVVIMYREAFHERAMIDSLRENLEIIGCIELSYPGKGQGSHPISMRLQNVIDMNKYNYLIVPYPTDKDSLVSHGVSANRIICMYPKSRKECSFTCGFMKKSKWKHYYLREVLHHKLSPNKKYNRLATWLDMRMELGEKIYPSDRYVIIGCNGYARKLSDRFKSEEVLYGVIPVGEDSTKGFDGNDLITFNDLCYLDPFHTRIYVVNYGSQSKTFSWLLEMGFLRSRIYSLYGRITGGGDAPLFDWHLGYSRSYDEMDGFKVFRNTMHDEVEVDFKPIRIVTLGGSTSDPKWGESKSWSEVIFDRLSSMGIHVELYAGGIGGYAVTQEMLKLLRDGVSLHPDIVISYSGVNDVQEMYYSSRTPMFLGEQERLTECFFKNNDIYNSIYNRPMTGVSYGVPDKDDPADHWIRCQRTMQGICEAQEIKYLSYLQPYASSHAIMLWHTEKHRRAQLFYRKCREESVKHEWMHDLSGIFDNEENVFFDFCHVTEQGNRRIARSIMPDVMRAIDEIIDKGL